jgi:DNA-binding GntR family transcriptional regulator
VDELVKRRDGVVAPLTSRVRDEIMNGFLKPGTHLTAQGLANRFGVSRSPIGEVLKVLAAEGTLTHEANRGYFVAEKLPEAVVPAARVKTAVEAAYFALAEDRLEGRVPDVVTAAFLKERYRLSSAEINALCTRIVKEGWLESRAGYGYQFTAMLNSAEALAQTYRFRMSIEPAAVLEPGYRLDAREAEECRKIEEHIIAGGVESMSIEELYERGVRFHELVVSGSQNPFYLDALQRINSIRRLIAYRSSATRERYYGQAQEHIEILDLLVAGRNDEASWKLRSHLGHVIHNLAEIRPILEPSGK